MQENNVYVETIRVSGASRVSAVAGSIAGAARANPGGLLAVQSVGVEATYRAVKAIIVATQFLEQDGLALRPLTMGYIPIAVEGQDRTAIRFEVKAERQ